jgi:long-chain acyl-CoA synthetase
MKGFEFPKALHLEASPFSIERDLITPKLSLKRPQLLKHYKQQVGVLCCLLCCAVLCCAVLCVYW